MGLPRPSSKHYDEIKSEEWPIGFSQTEREESDAIYPLQRSKCHLQDCNKCLQDHIYEGYSNMNNRLCTGIIDCRYLISYGTDTPTFFAYDTIGSYTFKYRVPPILYTYCKRVPLYTRTLLETTYSILYCWLCCRKQQRVKRSRNVLGPLDRATKTEFRTTKHRPIRPLSPRSKAHVALVDPVKLTWI